MKVYNVKEIADLLGTNPETVRRWIRGGRLGADQESRKGGNTVTEEDLAVFLKKNPKYASLAQKSNVSVAIAQNEAAENPAEPSLLMLMPAEREEAVSALQEAVTHAVREQEQAKSVPARPRRINTDQRDGNAEPAGARNRKDYAKADSRKLAALEWLLANPSEEHENLRDSILEAEMLIKVKKRAISLLQDEIRQLEAENQSLVEAVLKVKAE